jgi:hypothetical protein
MHITQPKPQIMNASFLPTPEGRGLLRRFVEARWAFFFDTLGIRYRYEPKRFWLQPDLSYLPDFWLVDHRCFIEIKGEKPEQREKMRLLAQKTHVNVYTFFGDVGVPGPARGAFVDYGDDYYLEISAIPNPIRIRYPLSSPGLLPAGPFRLNAYGHWGKDYGWCECQQCGMVALATTNPTIGFQCACPLPLLAPHTMNSPRMIAAYRAANQYRFLSGQKAS